MLWRNFFRDLRETASRLVSVVIITAIAVMIHTALYGILYNIDKIMDDYYTEQNVADYWITGTGLNAGDGRALEQLDRIGDVQPRIVLQAEHRYNADVSLLLYGVPHYGVNTPYITEGSYPADDREMMISDQFAAAQGLTIGDVYDMTITGTSQTLRLTICALIKSPECSYHVNATTPAPDYTSYGFAYVNEGALADLMGANQYNQICVTAAAGVSDEAFREQIHSLLGNKVLNILALEDNYNAYYLPNLKASIDLILRIFPLLFFLCAVLLMISNMTRIIENGRGTIGTLKALGYQDNTIMRYYLSYAALAVLVGFPLGAFPSKYLSGFIVHVMGDTSDLPSYTVVHDYSAWAVGFVVTAICCIGSAWLVSRSMLRETPAECMRPKPPGNTKPIFLERMTLLWRRFTFNQKYIFRNTLRNKVRMITCIVGISLCMALVFLAFALKDSMDCYADALGNNQNKYDIMADLDTQVTENQYKRLSNISGVEQVEYEMSSYCWIYSTDQIATATLTVAEDETELHLYNPYAEGSLSLPAEGITLERDLAATLGVVAGDSVFLKFSGDARYYTVTVTEVSRYVSGAYMSRSGWRALGRPYTPTSAYIKTADRQELQAHLDHYDFVSAWQTRESVTQASVDQTTSTSMVVYILILFGGGLACVVIYNLGIMSFFEQIRSLATLMVLGFREKEIKRLQLSENLIFAFLGILIGIPLGMALNGVIVNAITNMPLTVATTGTTYLLSAGITMLFALAVNWVIGRKMREIDMLGALKSVE